MAAKRKRELISSSDVAAAAAAVAATSSVLTPSSAHIITSASSSSSASNHQQQQFSFSSSSGTAAASLSSNSSSNSPASGSSTAVPSPLTANRPVSSPRITGSGIGAAPSPAYTTTASPSAAASSSPASPSSLKSYILLRHKSSLMQGATAVPASTVVADSGITTKMTENLNNNTPPITGGTGGGMASPTALITRRCNDMTIKSPHSRLLADGTTAVVAVDGSTTMRLADIGEEDATHHHQHADSTASLMMPTHHQSKSKKNRLNSTGSSVSSSTTLAGGGAMYNFGSGGGGLLSSSSAIEPLSDCGSPMSNLTSCKDPMSPATPLNVSNILHQFHIPGVTTQPSTPLSAGFNSNGGHYGISDMVTTSIAAAATNSPTTAAALLSAPQVNASNFGRAVQAALGAGQAASAAANAGANRAGSSAGREEVSSTAGINGYNSPDSGIGSDLRRRQSNNNAVPSSSGAQQQQQQQNSSLLSGGTNATLINNNSNKMAGGSAAQILSAAGNSSSSSSSSSSAAAMAQHVMNSAREAGASVAAAAAAVAAMSNGGAGGAQRNSSSGGGVGQQPPQSMSSHQQPQEELCLVCGDRASGYHYNALTCEGCKGFFRRSITKNAVYQCKYGGNCEIDMYMRRKCQECRLRKCLTVGMRPECVVPESQCRLKREAKMREQKIKQHHHHHHNSSAATAAGNVAGAAAQPILTTTTTIPSNTPFLDHHPHHQQHNNNNNMSNMQNATAASVMMSSNFNNNNNNSSSNLINPTLMSESPSPKSTSFSPNSTTMTTNVMMMGVNEHSNSPGTPTSNKHNNMQTDADLLLSSSPPSAGEPTTATRLSPQAEELISQLVACQEQFELPKQDDFSTITPLQFSGDEEFDRANRFQYVAEMAILTVQLIVEFAKRLPGFETLHREDQITLLKECTCELMILRAARRYDVRTDSIVFANNMPFTRDNYRSSGMFMNADAMYNFCRSLSVMETDNAEFAILAALSIFSDRPCILHRKQVEAVQDVYVNALREYETLKRSRDRAMFPRLIMRMTELRTLGHQWADLLFSLKLQKRRLPALLAEIWDFDAP